MRKFLAVVVGVGLCCASAPASAHHSFAAEFDIDKPVTLKGTLTSLEWVNPHGWLHIDVKQPDGTVVNYAVESGAAQSLLRRGLRMTDFPIGSEVIVEGFRARNGKPTVNGSSVKFADGRNFFLGAPPDAPQPNAQK